MPAQLDDQAVERAGGVWRDVGDTLVHNLRRENESDAIFEGRASNHRMPAAMATEFRRYLEEAAQAFLEDADNWLSEKESPEHQQDPIRLGVGVYTIIDRNEDRIMRFLTAIRSAAALSLTITLASCGGGGGSSAPAPLPGPTTATGIDRGGISFGTLNKFSSVFVNGIRFDTSNAIFMINGVAGSEADLNIGQVILVVGTINSLGINGTATQVIFNDNVKGPIEAGSIDTVNMTFRVLGQTIVVNADTVFDDDIVPQSFAGLSDGDFVEISGLVDADGNIVASFIDDDNGTEFEVRGVVSNLDTTNSLFNINDLVVDYSNAVLDNFPNGVIADGDQVEAKGISLGSNGELLATKVELESLNVNNGDVGEIEGFIADFVSPTDFTVNGIPITTNAATVFDDGTAANLANGVRVEIDGSFNANGVLVATKVDFEEEESNIRITATADSVNAAANSLTILGIQVQVDAATQIEDDSNQQVEPFTLNDVSAGDWLEIRGTETVAGSGIVLASRLERDDPENEVELRGLVESVNDPDLTILGVTIQTDANTQFRDVDDSPLLASEFFAMVSAGREVEAKGPLVAGTIVADEVEFEN